MIKGWEKKKLKDVCPVITDGTHQTPTYYDSGYTFLSSRNVTSGKIDWERIKYIDEEQHVKMQKRVSPQLDDILLAKNGTTGVAALVDRDIDFDIYVSLALLRPSEDIYPPYLLYYINSPLAKKQFNKRLKGIGVPNLHLKEIREVNFIYPEDFELQKRIVAILDEAFEAIDQAKANIERNIENAEELFQSKLNEVFSKRGEGWITEKLSGVFKMKSGDQLSQKNVVPGPYPVYGGNGITAHHYEFNLEGQQILIGRVGAQCGNIHLTNEKIWLTDNAFRVTDLKYEFDFEFLEHLLRVKDLRQTARQSAQPVISNSSCKDLQLVFPENISQQKEIAELINSLDTEVLQMIESFKIKIKLLEELKKSILQKAFSGELTANEHVAA